MPEVIPPQDQGLPFLSVELKEVPVSPFLHPVELPLDGDTALWHISYSSQFCVICKLVEGTLCPVIQIINEYVKYHYTQHSSLRCTANFQTPIRLCATDHHTLVLAIQLVFSSSHCLLNLLIFYQLLYEDLVGQSSEGLTGQVDSLPLIYQASHFISLVKYNFFCMCLSMLFID